MVYILIIDFVHPTSIYLTFFPSVLNLLLGISVFLYFFQALIIFLPFFFLIPFT